MIDYFTNLQPKYFYSDLSFLSLWTSILKVQYVTLTPPIGRHQTRFDNFAADFDDFKCHRFMKFLPVFMGDWVVSKNT